MPHTIFRVRLDAAGTLFLMPAPQPATLDERLGICDALGVTQIVSLLGEREAADLGLDDEAAACAAHDIAFVHFPIADFGLPNIDGFVPLVRDIANQLRDGKRIALHCRAGVGRSGMTASCIGQLLGHAPQAAIEIVGNARGKPIPDTVEQADFVRSFADRAGL